MSEQLLKLAEENPAEFRRMMTALQSKLVVPHPYQQEIMDSDARFQIVCCGRRFGKFCRLDEPIWTSVGWVEMGNLTRKHKVYGLDGRPCNITGIYPQGTQKLLTVTFKNGTQIVCGHDHLWAVRRIFRKGRANALEVLTTDEIVRQGVNFPRKDGRTERRFSVPVVQPVQHAEASLGLPPYTLGALLGDGSMCNGSITLTSADPEIPSRLSEELAGVVDIRRVRLTDLEKCPVYGLSRVPGSARTNPIKTFACENGINVRAEHKHVPPAYFLGSVQQRLDLLRGLMDTDGWLEGSGNRCAFASASKQLTEDLAQLVMSLGGKACRISCKPTTHLDSWVIRFYMPEGCNPFYLRRKADRWKPTPPERLANQIVSIEPAPDGEAQCIAVDSPDHLYLARDYIPTHNTVVGAKKALKKARTPNQMIWWTAPTYRVVKRGYREVLRQLPDGLLAQPAPRDSAFDAGRAVVLKFKNGTSMEFYSAERQDGMLGEGVDLAILDEAATMPKSVWEVVIRPTLMDRQGGALMLSTPRGRNWWYYLWLRGQGNDHEGYQSWQFSTADNPYIAREEIEEMRESMPLVIFQQEVLAQFISSAGSVFRFNPEIIVPRVRPEGHVVVGVDLAKTNDFTVFEAANSESGLPCAYDRFNDVSWPMQRNRLKGFVRKLRMAGASHVSLIMDSTGVGDPIVDDMELDGYDVLGINFTKTKQHMVIQLAKDLEDGLVRIGPDRIEELENYTYKITDNGRMTYSAPEGQHDDVCSAIMLRHWGIVKAGAPNITAISADDQPEADQAAYQEDDPNDWTDLLDDEQAVDTGLPEYVELRPDSALSIMSRRQSWGYEG